MLRTVRCRSFVLSLLAPSIMTLARLLMPALQVLRLACELICSGPLLRLWSTLAKAVLVPIVGELVRNWKPDLVVLMNSGLVAKPLTLRLLTGLSGPRLQRPCIMPTVPVGKRLRLCGRPKWKTPWVMPLAR